MNPVPIETIQADFDRLAHLEEDGWSHNSQHQPFLLRQLPPRLGTALEIGCGRGAFARLLADRSEHVVALDLSAEMLRIAQERSSVYTNIEYQQGDVLEWDIPPDSFDCIASIATLHHLPLEPILPKLRNALKPGGTLLVLDLYQTDTWSDYLWDIAAIPAGAILQLLKTGRLRPPATVRAAWAEHGQHDSYLTLAQIRNAAGTYLPEAQVRRHLLWRYSLVWHKR